MLKRYKLGLLCCLFSFPIIHGQSCLCDSNDTEGNHFWYTVIAPSGLILRQGPNSNSAKLAAIPFNEEVFLCGETYVTDTIEGIMGSWLKVTWADKTGYLFDGFIDANNDQKVQMVIPNSGVFSNWKCLELSPEIKWEAMMEINITVLSPQNREPIPFSSIDLKIGKKKVDSDCSSNGFLNNSVLNLFHAPFAVFSGFNLTKSIENQIRTPIKLMPGEIASFRIYDSNNHEERSYLITTEGNVFPNTNFMSGDDKNPIDRIEQYKINLYQTIKKLHNSDTNTPWTVLKLVDSTVKRQSNTDNYDMNVFYIYFAGDLDGDNQLDLILSKMEGAGKSFHLYLSSKKLPGFLLRYIASWYDKYC